LINKDTLKLLTLDLPKEFKMIELIHYVGLQSIWLLRSSKEVKQDTEKVVTGISFYDFRWALGILIFEMLSGYFII
jgi:hypothetical protein